MKKHRWKSIDEKTSRKNIDKKNNIKCVQFRRMHVFKNLDICPQLDAKINAIFTWKEECSSLKVTMNNLSYLRIQ